jgi:hypothetical protein
MYKVDNTKIIIHTNTGGFFSCCSIRLEAIIDYYNQYKSIPTSIDSSIQFDYYKIDNDRKKNNDISSHYFIIDTNENIDNTNKIEYSNNDQFKNYNDINYNTICPFIRKYFSPSDEIKTIINTIEKQYLTDSNIDYKNICAIFFRGNDKSLETKLPSYNDYIEKAKIIKEQNPSTIFLIQSDETEFINCMTNQFKDNTIIFKDYIRHINKKLTSVDNVFYNLNNKYSKYFLAIIIIISKCNYIICNTGNCSIWIMFYRENTNNIIQLPE